MCFAEASHGVRTGGMNREYGARNRSIQFNLADKTNPDFRAKVLRGNLEPQKLMTMHTQDMASEVRLPPSLPPSRCQYSAGPLHHKAGQTDSSLGPRHKNAMPALAVLQIKERNPASANMLCGVVHGRGSHLLFGEELLRFG